MKTYKICLIIILASLIFTPLLPAKEYDLAAEGLCSFGKAFLKQQRYAEARHEFQKCLIINPQHNEARSLLRLCERKITPAKDRAILLALDNLEKKSKAETLVITPQKKEPPQTQPKEISQEEESLAPPVQKGAWTLKKGQTYVELFTKYYWNNSQFNNGREKERWNFGGKYKEIMSQLKLEYGLTDTETILLYTTAKEANWKDDFNDSTRKGFTQIEPGIKHLIFTDPFIGTLQLKAKLPLHYSEEAVPALGKHQIDGEIKFLTAQPWPKLPGYTKFELGFRYRAEEPSNEIPYFFEFGYNLFPSLILKTTLDGQTAVGGGSKEDWLKYTVGPIFKIGDLFNIEFGYGNTFTGRNTSAAQEVFTTLSRQW